MKKSVNFFPFVFTFIILIIFLFSSPQLSNAGDNNISEFLSSSGKIKSGFFFISPALAGILRFFHHIYPANWWSIFSIVIMFSGLFTFLWFINRRYASDYWHIQLLLTTNLSLILWELLFKYEINFTQTTTIAAMTGILIILDMCFHPELQNRHTKLFKSVLGIFFLLTAGAIRWKALALTLPFAAMCLFYIFIFPFSLNNLKGCILNSWHNKKYLIILFAFIFLSALSSYGIHSIYSKAITGLGNQIETNAQREEIIDYIDRYPAYDDENSHLYKELEIDSSWIDMISNYATSDKNYFTSENLQKMIGLRGESQKTAAEFIDTLHGHTLLWVSLLIFSILIFLIRGWKNCILPFLGCFVAFVLCSLYFVYIGRFAWRVTNGYLLACILSYLVMTSHTIFKQSTGTRSFNSKSISVILSLALVVISAIAINSEKDTFCKPKATITNYEKAAVLDYINSRKENVYLYWDDFRFADAYNLWATHTPEYLDNYFPLISNFIFGCTDKLTEYEIHDIYADLLQMKNIRIQDGHWFFYRYLKNHYQSCIGITKIEEFNNIFYLRYSEPVFPTSQTQQPIQVSFSISDDYDNDSNVKQAFDVQCSLIGDYDDYWINVVDLETDKLYSYGLDIVDNSCTGTILCMKRTWDPELVEVSFVGKTPNGEIIQLSTLTDSFSSLFH